MECSWPLLLQIFILFHFSSSPFNISYTYVIPFLISQDLNVLFCVSSVFPPFTFQFRILFIDLSSSSLILCLVMLCPLMSTSKTVQFSYSLWSLAVLLLFFLGVYTFLHALVTCSCSGMFFTYSLQNITYEKLVILKFSMCLIILAVVSYLSLVLMYALCSHSHFSLAFVSFVIFLSKMWCVAWANRNWGNKTFAWRCRRQ